MPETAPAEQPKTVRKVVKKQPPQAAVLVGHFFSSTLWGVIGGFIIITALYVGIMRSPELGVQRVHVKGNQVLSSFEIGKQTMSYLTRFSDVIVPYPNRILQSSSAIESYLVERYPEIAEADVWYDGFNDLYITIVEQEARIVHCNSLPNEDVSCWQRSSNGRPLLKTPQNDFDVNPKLNTSIYLVNNILPAFIAEETLGIYRLVSTEQHRILACTYHHEKPDYECLMSTNRFGVVSLYIDAPSSKLIAAADEPIMDIVIKNIPKETETLSYIDLRFYPKIVYK
ncbi:MAG TPA: hypothetical protein VGE63_01795 [Candidatus Paceibacterota bacterium]